MSSDTPTPPQPALDLSDLSVRVELEAHRCFMDVEPEIVAQMVATIRALQAERDRLREAAQDMLAGWRYIREHHGDLYCVGWDRAQNAVEAALAASREGEK